jgi:hypothetical protein
MIERQNLYEELGLRVLPKTKKGVFDHWALGPHHGVGETTIPGRGHIKKALWRVAADRGEERRAVWRVANPRYFKDIAAFNEANRARVAALYAADDMKTRNDANRAAAVERIKKDNAVKDEFFKVSKSLFLFSF